MFTDSVDESIYIDCMSAIKKSIREYHCIRNSQTFNAGRQHEKLKTLFHSGVSGFFTNGCRYFRNRLQMKKLNSVVKPFNRDRVDLTMPDYFSDERIAVYTCIFGKYDALHEPFCHPNNIDYYTITDQPIPDKTVWKTVNISSYSDIIAGLSNVEKNRWFKMHPHEVFTDYRYSIYIDGNVVPVTDFTELANRISETGIAMFWHSYNNCVYQEAFFNRYSVRKISNYELEKHIEFLRSQGMPEDFGMTTCNVIARDHTNINCQKIMDDWWNEFMSHCRRDQISFPYVIWKNGFEMEEIATLGSDVWNADSLIVSVHE